MNISGIVVVVPSHRVAQSMRILRALPGVQIHHHDAATGRIVITQEMDATADPELEMRRLQELPDVVLVSLVYHYVEESETVDAR